MASNEPAPLRRVEFFVPGKPIPKGSMRPMLSATTRRAFVVPSNPKGLSHWVAILKEYASSAWDDPPSEKAIELLIEFRRKYPKSAFRTGRYAGELKRSFMANPYPTTRPDGGKLARAVEDALTGIIYADDSQIVSGVTLKSYSHSPGARIVVRELGSLSIEMDHLFRYCPEGTVKAPSVWSAYERDIKRKLSINCLQSH